MTTNLVVDTAIEDLAGNHVGQPFDIDTFEHITERITTKTISIALHGSSAVKKCNRLDS